MILTMQVHPNVATDLYLAARGAQLICTVGRKNRILTLAVFGEVSRVNWKYWNWFQRSFLHFNQQWWLTREVLEASLKFSGGLLGLPHVNPSWAFLGSTYTTPRHWRMYAVCWTCAALCVSTFTWPPSCITAMFLEEMDGNGRWLDIDWTKWCFWEHLACCWWSLENYHSSVIGSLYI